MESGFLFARFAKVDAAAGIAHVCLFSVFGSGKGVPGGGKGWPRPMGSVLDLVIEGWDWSGGRASRNASISAALRPSEDGGLALLELFLLPTGALLRDCGFCFAANQFLAAAVAWLRVWLMFCFRVVLFILVAPAAAAAAAAISCAESSLDFVRE